MSPASRQAERILAPKPTVVGGRPLTPLHAGQVGLVACSGLINGIFGSGQQRHIAAWKSKKVTTKLTEEEADGTTIIRERERFVRGSVGWSPGVRQQTLTDAPKRNHADCRCQKAANCSF